MRIALCMSGKARGVLNGWQGICANLLNPNVPDIFVHTWADEKGEQVQAIRDLYKPKGMVVEPLRHWRNARADMDRQMAKYLRHQSREEFVDRTYSMQYSMLQANLVKERYRLEHDVHYDCVIRARFDLWFSMPIECGKYDLSAIHLTDKCIPEMLDDRFAFSTNALMNVYSSTLSFYDHVNDIRSRKDGIFCAETLLYEVLKMCGIRYEFIPGLQILRVPLE
jgi:hypothetical protein